MQNSQDLIELNASKILQVWNEVHGTSYTDTIFERSGYTCSCYLSLYNEEESVNIRFSDHSGTRGGVSQSFDYSVIVHDIADEEWFEANEIDENDAINYRDNRFEINLDAFVKFLKR